VSAALCRDALLVPGPARSVKGRSILLRDMPNPEAKLRVLVLGAMHGDELSSTSVALHWIALAQDQPCICRSRCTGASFPRSTRTA
jgi:protein MpaA